MIRVESEQRDGVEIAGVIFDRPDKRNALTPDILAHAADAIEECETTCRAVVLAGEGPVFSAGFDLALALETPDGSIMRELLDGLSTLIRAMRRSPLPVVVAAHGAALAGGCALLGGADLVVSDPDAKLGYPVVRIGVSPAVSAPFLRNGVGDGRCRSRLLDPGLIDGTRAREIGLVHELAPTPEEVIERARAAAYDLGSKPAEAVASTKGWLNEIDGSSRDPVAEWALEASLALVGGDEERTMLARALKPRDGS